MNQKSYPKNIDVETVVAKILQNEIWKEITATTGTTKSDLDRKIIEEIVKIAKEK